MGDLPRIGAGVAVNVGAAPRTRGLCIDINIDRDIHLMLETQRDTPQGVSDANAVSPAVLLKAPQAPGPILRASRALE